MSNSPAVRRLHLPPENLAQIKVPKTKVVARRWYRIHLSKYDAIHFSLNIAHRFSHPDCPYPLLYLASDIDTCLFERFGTLAYRGGKTIPHALWQSNNVAAFQIPKLHVCDVTSAKTLSALMVDLSTLMHNDVTVPQLWGLAIQQHPEAFQAIKFKSRFNGRTCLGLFGRDNIEHLISQTFDESVSKNAEAVNWVHKHHIRFYK